MIAPNPGAGEFIRQQRGRRGFANARHRQHCLTAVSQRAGMNITGETRVSIITGNDPVSASKLLGGFARKGSCQVWHQAS